jgi:hypothetical protein
MKEREQQFGWSVLDQINSHPQIKGVFPNRMTEWDDNQVAFGYAVMKKIWRTPASGPRRPATRPARCPRLQAPAGRLQRRPPRLTPRRSRPSRRSARITDIIHRDSPGVRVDYPVLMARINASCAPLGFQIGANGAPRWRPTRHGQAPTVPQRRPGGPGTAGREGGRRHPVLTSGMTNATLEAECVALGFQAVNPEWFDDCFTVTAAEVRDSLEWDRLHQPNRSPGPSARRTSTGRFGWNPLPSRSDRKGPALASYSECWTELLDDAALPGVAIGERAADAGVRWGLGVVDCDGKEAALWFMNLWKEREFGYKDSAPAPWVVRSGGGGVHFWFLLPEDLLWLPSRFVWGVWDYTGGPKWRGGWEKGKNVEIMGDRKLVMAPPSIHPDTGRRYEWLDGYGPRTGRSCSSRP